jgi:hypothetical protein
MNNEKPCALRGVAPHATTPSVFVLRRLRPVSRRYGIEANILLTTTISINSRKPKANSEDWPTACALQPLMKLSGCKWWPPTFAARGASFLEGVRRRQSHD